MQILDSYSKLFIIVVILAGTYCTWFYASAAIILKEPRMNGDELLASKMRVLYSSEMPPGQMQQQPAVSSNGSLSGAPLMPQYPNQMRKKSAWKRSLNSLEQSTQVDFTTLKKEVAALLQDVPNHSLPLFKFREMFERRYRRSVSSYDLYRMRDVVNISENSGSYANSGSVPCSSGRNISLCQEWVNKQDDLLLYCKLHPPKVHTGEKNRAGWAEKEVTPSLPMVMIELKTLATQVHSMLESHNGSVPLLSFLDCYEFAFGPIELAEDGCGVPLEHLITCVHGVEIGPADNGMKQVQWSEKKEPEPNSMGMPQPQALQMAQLSRELIDLLKTFPRCCLPFSKLIPAYHHHFGRQCRVADYGHATLSSLLKTLPGTIQVMGENQNRVLTLAHRAQMKRFATDVLRVLKSQGGPKKEQKVEDFPLSFSQVFPTRTFSPEDYGLCYLNDLIQELVENSTLVALLKDESGNSVLAIPKREQTPQEMHKTRIFATEVFDLLRHSIRCEMPFSKFIPAYHHHFGRQCRVADYGFSKLAELFEAITDTVIAVNPNNSGPDCCMDDKILRLTPKEQIKVVGEQIWSLVEKRNKSGQRTMVEDLDELFLNEYGFRLKPELCEAENVRDLVENKLSHFITVEGERLFLVDRAQVEQLVQDAKSILENQPDCTMDLDEFVRVFRSRFQKDIDLPTIRRDLAHMMLIAQDENDKYIISLAPMRVFAREIVELLEDVGGYIPVSSFEAAYLQKFGRPVRPAQLGSPSLAALLQAIPDVVSIRGTNRTRRIIVLNNCPPASLEKRQPRWRPAAISGNGTARHQLERAGGSSTSNGRGNSNGMSSSEQTRCWSPKWRNHQHSSGMGVGNPVMPSPLYSPGPQSPMFMQRGSESIFSFDRPPQMSPPMYDMWVRDTGTPASPPVSPPMVWTYHPILYPPTPASPVPSNILMSPQYQFGPGPWSTPATQMMMYERIAPPSGANTVSANMSGHNGNSSNCTGQSRVKSYFQRLKTDE